jgi:hypothetical protein
MGPRLMLLRSCSERQRWSWRLLWSWRRLGVWGWAWVWLGRRVFLERWVGFKGFRFTKWGDRYFLGFVEVDFEFFVFLHILVLLSLHFLLQFFIGNCNLFEELKFAHYRLVSFHWSVFYFLVWVFFFLLLQMRLKDVPSYFFYLASIYAWLFQFFLQFCNVLSLFALGLHEKVAFFLVLVPFLFVHLELIVEFFGLVLQ